MSTTVRRVGRYALLEPVGWGAMGVVYRAEDPLIHRTVAAKVLHATQGLTPQQLGIARKRFSREAQSAGGIDHPNIIRILDVGEDADSGEMYIVMEYVSGPSLERIIHETEIDLDRAVEIIGQIASGLDAAHARGLIHRDIKPSNILVTKDGIAKIADFGITHVVSSAVTQDLGGVGTPAYMSPEHVTGHILDPRADLFSLGVLSYELLAGKRPFQGTDAVSIAYAIAHAQPAPISSANPRLPRALDGVMDRMLAKKPSERFASGGEFHAALLSCLSAGDDARASTPATVSRRRDHILWGVAGVVVVAAVVASMFAGGGGTIPPRVSAPAVAPVVSTRPAAPAAKVTISLAHHLRRGTLIVTLDGAPIFTKRFSASKLALFQTTTWDPVKAPAGGHKLRARVNGDNGKTYLSDSYTIELKGAKVTALRISFKGDALTVKQS